ncbi:transposase (fragment) [Clostridium neonatale]
MSSKTEPAEIVSFDTIAEHVKQLEDELLKVKIENAYLRELRRLRLEEEVF